MRRLPALLLFLLFLNTHFAVCDSKLSEGVIPVPAVIGNGGNVIDISIKLVDGIGNVYLTTTPPTGFSTQSSAEEAIYYAFQSTGRDQSLCDVLISIEDKGSANYVDGPSASGAISVLARGILEGKLPRQDAAMTGAVDVYGNVVPVGGLFEKAKATVKSGKAYLVTPANLVFEKLLLLQLKEKYGLHVIEVSRIDDAAKFILYGKKPETVEFSLENRSFPNVTEYDSNSGLGVFKNISLRVIELENNSINKLSDSNNESAKIKSYFRNEVSIQLYLLDKGYYFTAANEAFLNHIDVSTILQINDLNLEKKYNQINSCLSNLNKKNKTQNDFEYLIGADLREIWAKQMLQRTDIKSAELVEDKYYVYNDLMYADAWCFISGQLRNATDSSGTQMNESSLKEMASTLISYAENLKLTSQDSKKHLENSKLLFDQEKYAASIYDSTYAIEMQEAEYDSINTNLSSEINYLLSQKRTSLWGKIYQAQGTFLSQGSLNDQKNAYKILRFANALDEVTNDIRSISFADAKTAVESDSDIQDLQESDPDKIITAFLYALLIAFVLFVLVAFYIFKKSKRNDGYRLKNQRKESAKDLI